MPRKVIIGVIGATYKKKEKEEVPEEVLDLARCIGREIGTRDAILLTGGEPAEKDRSVKSFAMLGCQEAKMNERISGRMISVLPNCTEAGVDPVPGTRRVIIRTKLSSMGRNPITGGTPDRLIVLPGGKGTLVELAFALRRNDAVKPVFARPIDHLRWENARRKEADKILDGIKEAIAGFHADGARGIPEIDPDDLRLTLHNHLNSDEAQDAAAIARAAVDDALAGLSDQLEIPTRFEGLPFTNNRVTKEFERLVEQLSNLQPGDAF